MSMKSFYPNLATIVALDQFPEQLQFIENGLQTLLDNVYYKELQYVRSPDGSHGFYQLVLVTNEPLKIDLFNSGVSIIFNPGGSGETIIPLTIDYSWPILGLISNFSLQGFSYAPEVLSNLINRSLKLSDSGLIQTMVEAFEGGLHIEHFNSFVNKINIEYNLTGINLIPPVSSGQDSLEMTENVRQAIISNVVINNTVHEVINTIYIASSDLSTYNRNLDQVSTKIHQESITDYVKKIIIPKIDAELDVTIGLSFPRNILIPLDSSGLPIDEPEQSILIFDVGTLFYRSNGGIGFDKEMDVSLNHPSQIGNTGIGINIQKVKLDLSRTTNISEADADGRDTDFIGVYAEEIDITLPEKWFKDTDGTNATIFGKNLLIGTGGLSGTIGLEATGGDGMFWASLGSSDGFRLGFHSFDIQFKQNKVLSSNIEAAMEISKFVYPDSSPNAGQPVTIGIKGHIHDDGSFNLTASTAPPYPIELPDIFTYNISSLELGREGDGDFYIGTSGSIEFQGFLKDTLKLKEIDIDKLRIYSDGTIEFEGGSIALTEPIVLALGPVEITVTAIHYGSHQKEVNGEMRKFNYFGFDGGISVDPLGVEVRGDGVKFYYCTDDLPNKPSPYLHIQTLYLDLTIPASSPAAIINGWLSIPEPGVSKEYAGGIKLQLPQAKISGSADMKLMPKYPAFIIDVSIDLPAPITIGPVGIYGFRGLIGYRYVAEKEAAGLVSGVNSWYEYYKVPPRGIHVTKFNGPDKTKAAGTPFSIGAGASLGTSADNGTILNIKAMILLSIPSLFMIDGKAAVLSARLGLDDPGEPPFFAFIAVGDNSLELGFGADFKMPTATGKILKLYADIQAGFFFNDSSKWYVNVGTKTNPITARVIELVTIKSYLMLSAKGIEAGARGEFDFKREYGPIKVHAWAYIEIGGKISFERPQFGAYMAAGVGADIDIKIVSLYASFDVLFGVEGAKPFKIYGEFRLCVSIKIAWVFKFKFCGNLSIMWEFDQQVDRTPVNPLINERNAATIPDIVKGVNMLSNETFELAYLGSSIPGSLTADILNHILPLDTYVDIKTEKGFLPGAITSLIGGYTNPAERYTDLVPPEKIIRGKEVRQVKHQYSIENLVLKSWNSQSNNWQDYHPYKALYPTDPAVTSLKIGQFQKTGNQYNTIRLLATTPFSYTEQGEPGWFIPEQNGMTAASLFCEGEQLVPECANFLEKPLGTMYYCYNQNQLFYSNEAAFLLLNRQDGDFAQVVHETNPFNFQQSLSFPNRTRMQVRLPEPSVEVTLRLSTYSQGVRVKYFASLIDDGALTVPYGNPDQTSASPNEPYIVTYNASMLNSPLVYSHPEWLPVTRIEIEPLFPNQAAIDTLIESIAQINYHNNQIALGLEQGEQQNTRELEAQLIKLQSEGCQTERPEEPCKVDERYCALYNALLDIQNSCLTDPRSLPQEASVQPFIECLAQAYSLIKDFYYATEQSEFIHLQSLIIFEFTSNPNKETYTAAWESLLTIMSYVYEKGNCGCSDAPVTKCYTLLHSVCWLSLESYQYNINIPSQAAITADSQAAIDGITQYVQPIWRPDTSYVVQFTLKDTVDDGASSPGTYTYTYGFTTAGPVGFFHKHANANYGDLQFPERYPLTSLTRYIDYNRSYPNADGNLLNSKPLFYDDETTQIYLFYSKAYATHFFQNWENYNGFEVNGRIKIVIKDPREGTEVVNPPRLDYDPNDTVYTNIPQTVESWEADPNPVVPFVFEQYANLINANTCLPFGGNAIIPPSQFLNVKLKRLKPLKLYTALVNNMYDLNKNGVLEPDNQSLLPNQLAEETTEVHKFTFQTSRYRSFKEQVNSFILNTENNIAVNQLAEESEAAYSLTTIQAGLDTVTGTPNATADALIPTYPNKYDRVLQGLFGLPAFTSPAEGTEIRLIRDTNTNTVIAAIIISATPLNSSWVSEADVFDLIHVLDSSDAIDSNFKIALNAGYTQAIIMHTALAIPSNPVNFRFQHPITREAFFKIDKAFNATEIQAAFDTITGVPNTMSDSIVVNYQHAFDRVIEGLLALPPMDKAISTEYNAIRNEADGNKIVAVLIRNPEPFNNPKMPLDDVLDTIQVLDGAGNEDTSYKKLFSKDYSQVIVMKNGLEISGPLDIRFRYKIWDGNTYIVPSTPGYSSDEIGTITINGIDLQNF